MDDEMLVEESSLDRVDDELKKILKRRRRKSHSGSPEQLDKIIEANKQKQNKMLSNPHVELVRTLS